MIANLLGQIQKVALQKNDFDGRKDQPEKQFLIISRLPNIKTSNCNDMDVYNIHDDYDNVPKKKRCRTENFEKKRLSK